MGILYWGNIGIMEKKMETIIIFREYFLILYWCNIGISGITDKKNNGREGVGEC